LHIIITFLETFKTLQGSIFSLSFRVKTWKLQYRRY